MANTIQTFGSYTYNAPTAAVAGVPTDIQYRWQVLHGKRMYKTVQESLILDQFAADTEAITANRGSLTMRYWKRRRARRNGGTYVAGYGVGVRALTEGTAPTEISEVSFGYVDVSLSQIGDISKISDVQIDVELINDILNQNVEAMGQDAALNMEERVRNAIVSGIDNACGNGLTYSPVDRSPSTTNNLAGFTRFAGVDGWDNTGKWIEASDRFTSLVALDADQAVLNRDRVLGQATFMRDQLVPEIKGGGYVMVVPPRVMSDMRRDETWLKAATNVDTNKLYKRERFEIDGVRFVEGTVDFREDEIYGTYDEAGGISTCMMFGDQAFGCPKFSGSKTGNSTSPWSPKVIILPNADKTDPLNQFVSIGWKGMFGCQLLYTTALGDRPFVSLQRVKTSFTH